MNYTEADIKGIVDRQREYFRSGTTLPVKWRIQQLKKLKNAIIEHEQDFIDALQEDLGKSALETYLSEIGASILEINETIRGLKRWARPERHLSGLLCFPSIITKVYKMPYGVSLIFSPFNFPVLLTLGVLTASIAGGNTAVIKTSSKSKASSDLLKRFIDDIFPKEYVTVINGGHDVADLCLQQRFDKIFYTGSPAVGKHVLSYAANNLTPVALELGGENGNWCIIRKDADIEDAARKIAFFKLFNAGQICININQIAVAEEVADQFLDALGRAFVSQIGPDPVNNPDYPKLISRAAFDRCASLCDEYRDRIVFGGNGSLENLRFAPTVIYPVDIDEHIVKHELFNPLLPVVRYKDTEISQVLESISDREHPLAMYIFTKDVRWAENVMKSMQFGGGCVNEVCLQLMVKGVPFNGTGHSGMGAYHGEWGFREFTHPQTVLYGSKHFNLPLREHPYNGKAGSIKMRLIRMFEK